MATETTTYAQLLDRIIDDGIAAARVSYADRPFKLRGSIEGFEACRGKSPAALVELHFLADQKANRQMSSKETTPDAVDEYWRLRCFVLEVEWVCNVVSAGVTNSGHAPLLAHQPTSRGVMKYAEIVGVRSAGLPS